MTGPRTSSPVPRDQSASVATRRSPRSRRCGRNGKPKAQVTKQTASFLVDQLVRGGYVERVVDPRDARARLVRIAPKGRRAQELAAGAEGEVYAEWEVHLGAREMARLRELVGRLREVTDPYRDLDPQA